jgi:pimeloyl-ACP methyl ester carboxylesterase
VFVDGSQFEPAMESTLKTALALPDGVAAMARFWFLEMFTEKTSPAVIAAIQKRVARLPRRTIELMLTSLVRYDIDRLDTSLSSLRAPVMAIQATYSNESQVRMSMTKAQTTPYLDMLRTQVPTVRIEIIQDTGHFPQIDEPERTNALIDSFIATLPQTG